MSRSVCLEWVVLIFIVTVGSGVFAKTNITTNDELLLEIKKVTSSRIPKDRNTLCEMAKDPRRFMDLVLDTDNLIGFKNPPGPLGIGLCWWHSLFQRNGLYLTTYAPSSPKPDQKKAKELIKAIAKGKNVVEIPGYSNFDEFTYDWKDLVEKQLASGQRKDILTFKWLGSSRLDPSKLRKRMDEFFEGFKKNKISYAMLKAKKAVAHAGLIVQMKKREDGYEFWLVDSNSTDIRYFHYQYGSDHIAYDSLFDAIANKGTDQFVPYLQNEKDFQKINQALTKYCGFQVNIGVPSIVPEDLDITRAVKERMSVITEPVLPCQACSTDLGTDKPETTSKSWSGYLSLKGFESKLNDKMNACLNRTNLNMVGAIFGGSGDNATTSKLTEFRIRQYPQLIEFLKELKEKGISIEYGAENKILECLGDDIQFVPGVVEAMLKLQRIAKKTNTRALNKVRKIRFRFLENTTTEAVNSWYKDRIIKEHGDVTYTILIRGDGLPNLSDMGITEDFEIIEK